VKAYKHGVHGNRGTVWSPEWERLASAYGGNGTFADQVGVSYNTVYRWAVKGDPVPRPMIILIRLLAEAKGLKSPV
jgi:hypothetical protein